METGRPSSLMSRISSWAARMNAPHFDWIQVEVTSHCNAACSYCPRTVCRDGWQNRHMDIGTFTGLKPVLGHTKLVYLQGWGEPFLNRDLFAMVRMAKESGCMVGMTTNGTCLDESMIEQVMDAVIDIIALSLAGTDGRNDEARRGTRLDRVLEVVDEIREARKRKGSEEPAIHIAYMLLRSGLDMLSAVPALLRNRGIAQVVISTLDFSSDAETDRELLTPSGMEEYNALRGRLDQVVEEGRRLGVPIHYHLVRPGAPHTVCTENITRAFFVSADGSVSPCVYMNIPVSGAGCRRHGEGREYKSAVFGTLTSDDVRYIWHSPAFRGFREGFVKGIHPLQCRACPKLYEE